MFCFGMGVGGVFDLTHAPDVVAAMTHLGYPAYLLTIIGVAKIAAAITLLVPGVPRLKEWAYAGSTFDLLGASASHFAVGDGAADVITPMIVLGIGVASYVLRPPSRRL